MRNIRHIISTCFSWIGFITFAAFFFPEISRGQGLYNESDLLINGVNVYVDGDLENRGRLDNNGLISFTGDWESEGSYKGNGILEANGRAPQKIEHYDQKISSLVISGWGTKYIKGKINILDKFQLSQGIVEVSPNDVLKLIASAVIFGGSGDSYVDGAITVEGTGYKFFPVGKNGTYAPIEFLNVKGELSEYSMEVFDNAPVVSVDNVIVRNGLYWQRKDVNGQFGGSAIAIDFERSYFQNPGNIIMLAGTDWEEPFIPLTDLEYSDETDKISTRTEISAPIIMLGEISEKWSEADFYFSNALSPNALNSDNRKVKVFGDRLAAEQFQFQVYDRWGAMVFESASLDFMATNGWDGRSINGKDLMGGTYPYRLTAFDKTGRKFEKKGVITIIY
ncbi:MAG: gliding motility-associated C-terminal domain-containing protein [Cyclobacteriaceae bacterium]